jgi:hypothetical protein
MGQPFNASPTPSAGCGNIGLERFISARRIVDWVVAKAWAAEVFF